MFLLRANKKYLFSLTKKETNFCVLIICNKSEIEFSCDLRVNLAISVEFIIVFAFKKKMHLNKLSNHTIILYYKIQAFIFKYLKKKYT